MAEADAFLVASFALWAGDIDMAERLLSDFADKERPVYKLESIESPDALWRSVAGLRLRQIAQKRGEFGRIIALEDFDLSFSDESVVLETAHLRASIWRVDEREFLMKGYLTDLGWEREFFSRVASQPQQPDTASRVGDDAELEPREKPTEPIGGSWVVTGNPFIRVDVSDMGLIEARATWTQATPPTEFEPIRRAFSDVLKTLDVAQGTATERTQT